MANEFSRLLRRPPKAIVGLLYDIEFDEFRALHADGSESMIAHSDELGQFSARYIDWLIAVNGRPGRYCTAYNEAVEAFAHG